MKPSILLRKAALVALLPLAACLGLVLFSSFETNRLGDEFLKQLGITKKDADQRITGSILGGGLSYEGLRNAKNIALGNRKAVAVDLLDYTRKYVAGAAFAKEYNDLRESYKPQEPKVETPEEMKAAEIARYKKAVADGEATLAKADAQFKEIYRKNLEDTKKGLKNAEDPANKQHLRYQQRYPQLVKDIKANYDRQIADWNVKYPANPQLFVKKRLLEFMDATKDIDFDAETVSKNGKKIFVKPEYERKDNRWKLAYRAGRDVVTASRSYVEKWLAEIR